MSHLSFIISAILLFSHPAQHIIPLSEAVSMVPRDSVSSKTRTTVTVTGVVTVPSTRTDGTLVSFIQSHDAGIQLFKYNYSGPTLFIGDSVLATGKLGIYYGQEEIDSPQIDIIKRGIKVTPIEASVEQISNGTYHGMLVTCNGTIVSMKYHPNGLSIHFVGRTRDTATAYLDFRMDPQTDVTQFHDGDKVLLTGISTRFSYDKPFTDRNDLLLRSSFDIHVLPESFLDRYSGQIDFFLVIATLIVVTLGGFTVLLRLKVKQKTRQLEGQTTILKLFSDSVAELTGVLNRDDILTLALKRAHSLVGTRSVVFAQNVDPDKGARLTVFVMKDDNPVTETKLLGTSDISKLIGDIPDAGARWNTTIDKLFPIAEANKGESFKEFLNSHLAERWLSVAAPGKDLLVIFDHPAPISNSIPREIIMSYVIHVYSAYRAAELFDLAKEQGSALERLYNNSVFGLMTISAEGRIRTANRIAMLMFEDDAMAGKKVTDYLTAESADRFDDLLSGVASASEEKFVRFAAEAKKGRGTRDVEFALQFDPSLRIFYATVQDTSDRHYYEDFAAKENKIETLEKLASSLTHDLNNIIGSITGYASLLKRKLPVESKEYHYADIIENSSRKTTELVREVLGFAQVDAKSLEVVDLNQFTGEVSADFKKTRSDKYSILTIPFNRPVYSRVATSQIRQVILSVLANAAESMEGGGSIVCSIGIGDVPGSAPSYVKRGPHCYIEIEDHGLGMDDAIRRRIFEPFFTTKKVKKYTGLSLSMAYNIVKHHNGFISVDSKSGTGTKVRIFLPCYSEQVKVTEKRREAEFSYGEGTKILVVDDEDGVRQLASDILLEHGYSVVTANDGTQALERLKSNPDIRLVILDMVMPGMGGKDTCIEIKRTPNPPKVLICTGYSELADLESILGKHADGLLQKPYNTNDMASAVENLLSYTSQ